MVRSRAEYTRAFLELLEQKGFEEITVQEIIRKSTYSRAGFYRLFSDKYEFAQTIVREEAADYARTWAECMPAVPRKDPQAYLYQVSLIVLEHIDEKKALYRAILQSKIPGASLDVFCDWAIEKFRSLPLLSLRESMKNLDIEFCFYCMTHQFIRYVCYWESTGFSKTPQEMAEQIAALYVWLEPGKVLELS